MTQIPVNIQALISRLCAQGAQYVDVRQHLFDETETITIQNGELLKHQLKCQQGFGVRVLCNGAWGFASGEDISQLERLGVLALEQARRSSEFRQFPVALSERAPERRSFMANPKQDPWQVPLTEKLTRLLELDRALAGDGIDLRQTHVFFTKRIIRYYDSEGSELEKTLLDVSLSFYLYGMDVDGERQRRSFQIFHDPKESIGWESIMNPKLIDEAFRTKQELQALLQAPRCESEVCDVILLPEMMALQVHETIGHALELDRILGYELSYAGGSHVTLADFGHMQFGTQKLNAWADGTTANSPGSVGFDDDGVLGKKMPLIQQGKLVGAITSRQMITEANQKAGRLIFTESGGANRAESYNRIPIERMNNINLDPGPDGSLEDIIAKTKNGLLLETARSWSIGPYRENFHFATEVAWKIKDGKIAHMVRNATYSGDSKKFWHSLDQVGSADTWQLQQVFNCGKGQPNQFMRLGHGVPICRFQNVQVGH